MNEEKQRYLLAIKEKGGDPSITDWGDAFGGALRVAFLLLGAGFLVGVWLTSLFT